MFKRESSHETIQQGMRIPLDQNFDSQFHHCRARRLHFDLAAGYSAQCKLRAGERLHQLCAQLGLLFPADENQKGILTNRFFFHSGCAIDKAPQRTEEEMDTDHNTGRRQCGQKMARVRAEDGQRRPGTRRLLSTREWPLY